MKKKLFIASLIFLTLVIIILIISLRQAKKQISTPNFNLEETAEQTKYDYEFGQGIKKIYDEYPWYGKIPVVNDNYEIDFDFEEKSFRIFLINDTKTIRDQAVGEAKTLGPGSAQIPYYFITPDGQTETATQSGFQNLLN